MIRQSFIFNHLQAADLARAAIASKLAQDDPNSIWMCLDGWSAATTSYIGAEICKIVFLDVQGVFFNWSYPKNYKFFSVSKMFRTFKLVPP